MRFLEPDQARGRSRIFRLRLDAAQHADQLVERRVQRVDERRAGVELRELVRPHDVVARLGGDEFALLLLDLPTGAHSAVVVDRVRERLSTGWPVVPGSRVRLRGSVGTASFPEEAADLTALLRTADARMYEGKRARRGR